MAAEQQVRDWVQDYVRAWSSNAEADIAALFTPDAEYRTEPFSAPWQGRDEIVVHWLGRRDEPGDAAFQWAPVVVTDELAVVAGEAVYRDPPRTYSNLWLIRLAGDGRCTAFTEWWMQHP